MFRVINEYMEKITLKSDDNIYNMFVAFLKEYSDVEIKKYTVNISANRFVLDIRLIDYSVDNAKKVFDDFNRAVSYPYSALHVRFNEGKCVRYRFITTRKIRKAFIVIL